MRAVPRQQRIAAAILGVPAVGLALMAIFSDEIMETLRRYFPEGAVPQGAIFFGLAGVTMTGITVSNLRQAASARGWSVTRGRIVSSDVEKKWQFASATRGAAVRTHQARVEYRYRVDGREYRSRRLRLGATVWTDEATAGAEAARFSVGVEVEVRYDPRKPDSAVLEPVVAFKPLTFLIIAVFFGLTLYFSGAWPIHPPVR